MPLSQQVSGSSYFTLVPYQPQKKHICMPPRRVHLDTSSSSTTPKSSPAPTKKKNVRFCSDEALEQVRLFIKTQTPLSVRSDPPPMPTTRLDIQYPNWPSKWSMYKSLGAGAMVRMENVQLIEQNQVLMGRLRVANVAFEKQVTVRYSLDHWKTYREITASFRESLASISSPRSWDRFTFEIDLTTTTTTSTTGPITCWIALCYHVNQQVFWDNNDGKNYQIDLVPIASHPSSTPPLSDTDEEEEEEDEEEQVLVHDTSLLLYPPLRKQSSLHALDQLTSRYSFSNAPPSSKNSITTTTTTLPSPQLGYQDFISKYCFYNSPPSPSSIVQN